MLSFIELKFEFTKNIIRAMDHQAILDSFALRGSSDGPLMMFHHRCYDDEVYAVAACLEKNSMMNALYCNRPVYKDPNSNYCIPPKKIIAMKSDLEKSVKEKISYEINDIMKFGNLCKLIINNDGDITVRYDDNNDILEPYFLALHLSYLTKISDMVMHDIIFNHFNIFEAKRASMNR